VKDEHRQFGWTEDPNAVELEPEHELVEWDDDMGGFYRILSCTDAFRVKFLREIMYNEFRNNLTK